LNRVYTITWFKQLKLKSFKSANKKELARHDKRNKQNSKENKPEKIHAML